MTTNDYNEQVYLTKINKILNFTDEGKSLPQSARLLAVFLKNYRPCNNENFSDNNHTSKEIAEMFEEICVITYNEITEVMLYLGYTVVQTCFGSVEWGMRLVNSETAEEQ